MPSHSCPLCISLTDSCIVFPVSISFVGWRLELNYAFCRALPCCNLEVNANLMLGRIIIVTCEGFLLRVKCLGPLWNSVFKKDLLPMVNLHIGYSIYIFPVESIGSIVCCMISRSFYFELLFQVCHVPFQVCHVITLLFVV